MGSIPLAANNLRIPQPADPLQQVGQVIGFRAMMNQQALQQQQLQQEQEQAPLRAQALGQQVQAQELENQKQQIALDSQKAQIKLWSDPQFTKTITANAGTGENGGAGFDPNAMISEAVKGGVAPADAQNMAAHYLDIAKNASAMTKERLDVYTGAHQQLYDKVQPILDMPVSKAQDALDSLKQELRQSPIPGLDPGDLQLIQQADLQHLPAMANVLGFGNQIVAHQKNLAEARSADQNSDPLFKLENDPSEMTGDKAPAALTMLQSRLADPNLAPADKPRVQRLIGQAQTAVKANIAFKESEDRAQQAVADGDPKAAAQLLISGTVAPAQLLSTRRPAFAQQAFSLAQSMQPGWNAQKADADFNNAKSPASQTFFGSANSLLNKGGTLDQLANQSQALPNSKFPKLNTMADYLSYNYGDPATAAFAATALGVADDYAKVMGGGTGSDTARLQVLQSLSASHNQQTRTAVLQNVRNAVTSQRDSRIGANPILQQMYGAGAVQASEKGGANGAQAAPANLPAVAVGFTRIQASDGRIHDIPSNKLSVAKMRDPGLKVQ